MEHFEDPQELGEFFRENFTVTEVSEDESCYTLTVEGEANTYIIHTRWHEENLLLTVDPYGPSPRDDSCALRLHRYLLQANDEMRWGFFSVDQDGSIELNINLPSSILNDHVLKRALDHLLFYADRHYFNVLNLANNARLEIVFEEPIKL